VVDIVRRGQNFGLVDIVYADGLEDLWCGGKLASVFTEIEGWRGGVQNTYLAFNEVSNASLGHNGNGNGLHDLLDHAGVGHAGDATLDADISGDTLESHDGGGTGLLSNTGLKKRTNMSARCN
jgi:hypothetical protein